jgi:hypothetical protein
LLKIFPSKSNFGTMQKWRTLTPSAELIVDPECGARGIIRDTPAGGVQRFHWSVIPGGQSHTVAEGRTGDRARARSVAEMALGTFAEDWLQLRRALDGSVYRIDTQLGVGCVLTAADRQRPALFIRL